MIPFPTWYYSPKPSTLSTVDEVSDWLSANKLRGRVETRDDGKAIHVATDAVAMTFSAPVPIGSLSWVFLGQP